MSSADVRKERAITDKSNLFCLISTLIFLAPLFFVRLFVGAVVTEYWQMQQITLQYLGYLSDFAIIGITIRFANICRSDMAWFAIFIGFSIFQLMMVSGFVVREDFSLALAIIYFVRGAIHFLAVYLYAKYLFAWRAFLQVFVMLSLITFTVAILSKVLYQITGIPYQLHISYGPSRVQAFMSEPSALAPVVSSMFLIACLQRRIWLAFVSLVVGALTYSFVVFITVFLSTVLFGSLCLVDRVRNGQPKIQTYSIAIFLFVISAFILSVTAPIPGCESSARFMIEYGDASGVANCFGSLKSRYWSRGVGMFRALGLVKDDGLLFWGYGLNVSSYLTKLIAGDILEYGLLSYLISCFGLPMGSTLFCVVGAFCFDLIRTYRMLGAVSVSYFIAASFNSAGGFFPYGITIAMAIVQIRILLKLKRERSLAEVSTIS